MMGVNSGAEQSTVHLHANKLINLFIIFGPDSWIDTSENSKHQLTALQRQIPSRAISISFLKVQKKWLDLSASRLPWTIIHARHNKESEMETWKKKSWGKLAFIIDVSAKAWNTQ